MLAVTIRAHRRLQYASRHRLAVYARLERGRDIAVAHAAGFRHCGPERRRPGDLDFVRRAMAGAALGRGRISLASFLAVDAAGVLGRYLLMAACADWLRNSVRVRVVLVLYMAGLAADRGVRRLLQFLLDVMAGGAGSVSGILCQARDRCCPDSEENAGDERRAAPVARSLHDVHPFHIVREPSTHIWYV